MIMFDFIEDVTQLCRDWPHLDRSFEKYAIAAVAIPVLLIGFVNLPWILFCVFTWLLVSRFYLSVLLVVRTISCSVPFLWKARPSQRLLTGPGHSVSGLGSEAKAIKMKPVPGRTGLPFIGETVSFLADSRQFLLDRQRQFGDTYQTSIDFSGTFLAARRVICLFQSTVAQSTQPAQSSAQSNAQTAALRALSDPIHTKAHGRSQLKCIGYSGLYGSSQAVKQQVPILAERVLNEARNMDRWEDVATPIIQAFLRRLIFESNFSFADRVNELACELVSAVFLNIPGYSPALQQSLDRYLTTSLHNPSFNASLKDRKQISNCIHVAAYEEDRRYFARDWQDFDADSAQQQQHYGHHGEVLSPGVGGSCQFEAVLSELLELCTDVLKQSKLAARNAQTARAGNAGGPGGTPRRTQLSTTLNSAESGSHSTPPEETSTEVTSKEAHDLLFIFLVEVVYSTLVQQLRSLAQYIVANQGNASAQARDNYKAYLTARQLVGNLSGTGLARFSWASTLEPDEELAPDPEGYEQEGYPQRAAEQSTVASHAQQPANVTGSTDEEREYYPHSTIGSYLLSHIWQPSPSSTPARPVTTKKSGEAAQRGTPQRPLRSPPPSPIPSSGSSTRQLPAPHAFPVSPDADVSADAGEDHDDLNYSCSTTSTAVTATSVGGRDGVYAVATTTAAVCTVTTETTATMSSSTAVPRRYTDQRPPYIATTPTRNGNVGAISASSPLHLYQITPSSRTQTGSSSLHGSTPSSAGRRYSGKYGPRKTPQKTPQRAGQNYSDGVTPSRSVRRSASHADTRDFPSPMYDRSLLGLGGGYVLGAGDGIALGDVSMGGSGSVASVSKNDWKYREMLIIQYITSIKDLVWSAKASTVLTPLPLQYSLHLCTQTHDIVRDERLAASSASAENVQFSIHKDDLVIQVHSGAGGSAGATDAGATNGAGGGGVSGARAGIVTSPFSQSPLAAPAHHDIGLFSELVLSIFTHELITGYLWEAPGVSGASVGTVVDVSPLENFASAHVKEPPGFCTVPNNGVSVRKYRTSNENISFLISAQGQGGAIRGYGGDCEDNVRYYSDGL